MTKDETLDWLYRLRSNIGVYMPREWNISMVNALDTAIKALEQEPCEDAVSRQAIIDEMEKRHAEGDCITKGFVKNMPSVNPQEPKMGHWIEEFNDLEGEVRFTCSSCGKYQLFGTDYCYNCGTKMVEPQKSEG